MEGDNICCVEDSDINDDDKDSNDNDCKKRKIGSLGSGEECE